MIRVLIVDDQALVREGFRMILDAQQDIEVVGEAGDGLEALAVARERTADIVLMDIQMPKIDGLEAARRLLARDGEQPRVVMLTTFDDDQYVYEALRAGASGFLLKDAPRSQLINAVRTVAAGDEMLAPAITRRLIERCVRRPTGGDLPAEMHDLSGREREVLKLLARGLSNTEIARELVLSASTVKTHVASVLQKLRVRDRLQAVVLAYESGLIQPGREHEP